MHVRVVRTHERGLPVNRRELDRLDAAHGQIMVSLQHLDGLKRGARVATLRPTTRSIGPPVIPDLFDLELIAFANQAMTISGFEELDGRRFYQSWWVRWD
jgi:hypothetical protein